MFSPPHGGRDAPSSAEVCAYAGHSNNRWLMGRLRFAPAPRLLISGVPWHKESTHEVSGNSNRGHSQNPQVPEPTLRTIVAALMWMQELDDRLVDNFSGDGHIHHGRLSVAGNVRCDIYRVH